jgi:predicted acyltransferase
MLILILLGIFKTNGLTITPLHELRLCSVLGRIGIAWAGANIIYLYTKDKSQLIWCAALLIGYWLLLKFTSAPGYPPGDLTMQGNLVSCIDRCVIPGNLYMGIHDPEGLVSTIPAISTGLLGIFAGKLLKNSPLSPVNKALRLAAIGVALVAGALLWNFDFPINKNLWTSSFVLLTGGLSFLLLSLFYYIIDVLGYHKWAFFFRVIGVNSILIYISSRFIQWDHANNAFFKWAGQLVGDPYNTVAMAIGFTIVKWAFLYFLYKQKVFLRV